LYFLHFFCFSLSKWSFLLPFLKCIFYFIFNLFVCFSFWSKIIIRITHSFKMTSFLFYFNWYVSRSRKLIQLFITYIMFSTLYIETIIQK
jgi:hypothetical protein